MITNQELNKIISILKFNNLEIEQVMNRPQEPKSFLEKFRKKGNDKGGNNNDTSNNA